MTLCNQTMIKSAVAHKTLRQRGRTRRRTERPPGHQKPAGSVNPGRDPVGIKPHPQRTIQRKLGKRIQNLREKRGLTDEKLAKRCGIKTIRMNKIERGEVNLAMSTILRVCNALHTRFVPLFRGMP